MGYMGLFNALLIPIPLQRGNGRHIPVLEGTFRGDLGENML